MFHGDWGRNSCTINIEKRAATLSLHYAADFDPKRIMHNPERIYGRMICVGFSVGCRHLLGESFFFGENMPT